MEPQIIILHPHDEERRLLKASIQDAVDWNCVDLADEPAAIQWLKHNHQPVGAIFIGGDEARFYRLIQLFRWHEQSRSALIYRLVDFFEQGWASSLSDLGEVADRILVKPILPHAIRERLGHRWKGNGIPHGSALIFDDAPTASSFEKKQLLETVGILHNAVHTVGELRSVFHRLEEKGNETRLLVCHWEMPSRRGAELLRRLNAFLEAKKRASGMVAELEVLIVTSRASLDRMRDLQQAASEVSGELFRPLKSADLARQLHPIIRRVLKQQRADSFLREATLFISREKYEYASDILDHAVRTLPDVASLFGGLGGVLFARGVSGREKNALARAANAYEMALRLEPMRSCWALKCLEAHVALGHLDAGMTIAKRCLLRFPFNDSVRIRLAQIYLKNGDSRNARTELRRALQISPAGEQASSLLKQLEQVTPQPIAG